MAIILNDNIRIEAGKPTESKYLSNENISYSSVTHVNNSIPIPLRHIGLTVNVNNEEYWYRDGVSDIDLVLKSSSSSGGTINDIQNIGSGIGIFSGITETNVANFRSIIGSGDTNVNLSGDTIVISSSTGVTSLSNNILEFNENTFQPYQSQSSGVTFYYDDIPPTGDTRLNLNARLGVSELRVSTGITSTYQHKPGDIYWDNDDSTITIQQTDTVKQQVGQELFVKVKNNTASTIPNGTVVYLSGSDSGRPTINHARASKNDDTIINQIIGVTTENVLSNQEGFVTTSGLVRGLNTTGFTEGDVVYVSPTQWGGLTNVRPTYPNYVVEVGIITNIDGINGRILAKVNNVSIEQNIRGVEIVNPPFTASSRSDAISVVGAGTIYLPATPYKGQEITVMDHDGDAGNNFTIGINGNGYLINGEVDGLINTNYGSVTMLFNGTAWRIISLVS